MDTLDTLWNTVIVILILAHLYTFYLLFKTTMSIQYKLKWTLIILMLFPIGAFLYFLNPKPEGFRVDSV